MKKLTNWFGQPMTAAALALGLLAAACGGDSATTASVDVGTEAFGLTEEEFASTIEAVESDIADCMSEAGFEYVPADVGTVEDAQAAVRSEPGMSREEYKAMWGFGVSTRFDDPVREIALGENLASIENLGEAERIAYEQTLFGEDAKATFAFTLDEEDFSTTGGCTRTAVESHFTDEQLAGTFVNPKDALVSGDPRMVEAQDKWSACMSDAGFEYGDQDDIIGELEERFAAIVGESDPQALGGSEANALAALQADEVELAQLDLVCSVEHLDPVEEVVEEELLGGAL